jgi:acyl-CoA thioester hydrolase
MAEKQFRYQHRVSYAECTVGNHIYYGRYLEILERARGEFARSLGRNLLELQESDTIFPVLEVCLKYKAPARYDDVLNVNLWVSELDRVRVRIAYRVERESDQKLILEGSTLHVCTSTQEKPKRIPEVLGTKLREFLMS